jgi:hypothetical protein
MYDTNYFNIWTATSAREHQTHDALSRRAVIITADFTVHTIDGISGCQLVSSTHTRRTPKT